MRLSVNAINDTSRNEKDQLGCTGAIEPAGVLRGWTPLPPLTARLSCEPNKRTLPASRRPCYSIGASPIWMTGHVSKSKALKCDMPDQGSKMGEGRCSSS
jgi:hypothetical protein